MARTRGSVGGTRGGRANRRVRPLAIVVAAGLGLAPSALAAPAGGVADCHGRPVTVAAHRGEVRGTGGPDVIRLLGPATVHAGAGDDVVCGSPGRDRIDGGPGDDLILGGRGGDVLRGGPGRDHLYGEAGPDRVLGGRGADVLVRGTGADRDDATRADAATEGQYAISLLVSASGVGNMRYAGLRIGVNRSLGDATVPMWASVDPTYMSSLSWSDGDLSVYTSDDSPLPGGVVRAAVSERAPVSSRWSYRDGAFTAEPGLTPPQTITLINDGGSPVTAGVAQRGVLNGRDLDNPMSAGVLAAGETRLIPRLDLVTVFLTQARAGTMVPREPARSTSAFMQPWQATATFTYDDATGLFRRTYGTG